ncbi:aminotransferase class IV [Candidatus Woesearchaeota archaeon]|nr:aminotransferase class IV [Candidatus Woesearchaeota archaeon]
MYININGKLIPKEKACISVFDHGLLYGDGVFETLRTYNGKLFMADEHLNRLYLSAKQMQLVIPITKQQMKTEIEKTIKKNKLVEAYIRLTVTRGIGEMGLVKDCKSQFFIIAKEFIAYDVSLYNGVELIISKYSRTLPKIKSINFLANILAAREAKEKKAFDALFSHGEEITECTTSNFYIIKNGKLLTSPRVLDGITRSIVLKLAEKYLKVEIRKLTKNDLIGCDECFLTNTTMEIVPIVKIDAIIVGKGKAGKITKQLHVDFKEFIQGYYGKNSKKGKKNRKRKKN